MTRMMMLFMIEKEIKIARILKTERKKLKAEINKKLKVIREKETKKREREGTRDEKQGKERGREMKRKKGKKQNKQQRDKPDQGSEERMRSWTQKSRLMLGSLKKRKWKS